MYQEKSDFWLTCIILSILIAHKSVESVDPGYKQIYQEHRIFKDLRYTKSYAFWSFNSIIVDNQTFPNFNDISEKQMFA